MLSMFREVVLASSLFVFSAKVKLWFVAEPVLMYKSVISLKI